MQEKTSSSAHCDEELERQREAREREEKEREESERQLREERLHELERLETEKRETEVKAVVSDLVNYVVSFSASRFGFFVSAGESVMFYCLWKLWV